MAEDLDVDGIALAFGTKNLRTMKSTTRFLFCAFFVTRFIIYVN